VTLEQEGRNVHRSFHASHIFSLTLIAMYKDDNGKKSSKLEDRVQVTDAAGKRIGMVRYIVHCSFSLQQRCLVVPVSR
jgi:hypothetical protein